MNDDFGRGRSPRWRWPQLARAATFMTAMTGLALLATACGGSSPHASTTGVSTYYQKALAYTHCMRSHGLPNYPDPNSLGQIPVIQQSGGGAGRTGYSQHALQSAQMACRNVEPGGGAPGSASQQEAKQAQALAFSQCMRAHGVPDFPDPSTINGGMGYNLSGLDTSSPTYQSANRACQSQSGRGQSSTGRS